ncbi:MAG: DNA cytosine methyltransferase [Candidatus Saccharibacteria bacterium]
MLFRMGELFCGPGGLALGAERAEAWDDFGERFNIRSVWANDIDHWTCETYRHNMSSRNDCWVIEQDVRNLDIGALPPIHGLAFGFPCNDFSVVGEQRGVNGNYGELYMYGVQAINIHRPMWFVAENVSGLSSANAGEAFIRILNDLATAGDGYRLTTHLYKFQDYGVPQCRHRIIIVGIRNDIDRRFRVPAPTTQFRPRTVREAIEDPPILNEALNHEHTRHSARVVEMLMHIPPGENAWSEAIPEELRLNVKSARMSQIYKRLDPDKPSYTVTGSGGGGTHMYHWEVPRALTNRERARIQTFPDDFVFVGPKENVRKQIGMAVPPEGAQVIFQALMNTFAGVNYDSIPPSWSREEEAVFEMA